MKKRNPWAIEKDLDRVGDEGVWLGYDLSDFSCLVRSAESPFVKAVAEAVWEPIRAKYRNRDVPEDDSKEAHIQIIANGLVANWEDMVDEQGMPLAFSPDAVARYARSSERFQRWVVSVAADRKVFIAALEEAEKNSSTASSGASSGEAVAKDSEKLH